MHLYTVYNPEGKLIPEDSSVRSSGSDKWKRYRGESMKTLKLGVAVSLLLVGSFIADAQEQRTPGTTPPSQVETKPTNCEFNVSVLTGAHRAAGDGSLVIMIARLGTGETRKELNNRRLHNARTFLIEFGQRVPQTIVTAEGNRVDGYGRVELYVGGKLFHVLMMRLNDDLAVGACSFEGRDPCTDTREKKLHPCLARSTQRQ